MAYKYLNDTGLKAYTKKVKGALKDLHTPIAISSENTTESKAQNVRNIADFVAKAKAAGIADVNGMAVSYIIDDANFGVGYLSGETSICGMVTDPGLEAPSYFVVDPDGTYSNGSVIVNGSSDQITSLMLTQGARKPIILTPDTTEVDEETYQKLFPSGITTNDVDVMFRIGEFDYGLFLQLESTTINDGEGYNELIFTGIGGGMNLQSIYIWAYCVDINTETPHQCEVTKLQGKALNAILSEAGYLDKSTLSPVLKEIDLTGTDAQRKAKLDQFEADWKALTGASDMKGARFVGLYIGKDSNYRTALFIHRFSQDPTLHVYEGISINSDSGYGGYSKNMNEKVKVISVNGAIYITPLFSHLEPVEIFFDNTAEKKKKNLDNLNAYKSNLVQLGVDTSIGFQVIFQNGNGEYFGNLYNSGGGNTYIGLIFTVDDNSVGWMRINADGEVVFVDLASEDDIARVNTPVPLTATTSTNKTQLDSFLSKVPNAQVMHVTYKDVYAGTLHKINGSWYGVLVGESNTIAGQLSIKLQADGTIVEGTA